MSSTMSFDVDTVHEDFFDHGWTDGLPIVPPTPERVAAMLAAGGADGGDVLGILSTRQVVVTAEKLAINAVMAGCKPEYFPVVLASFSALMDPLFNAHAPLTSTGGAAFCVIVSGPVAANIGLNSRHNVLGAGCRANATIGRTLRLVAINVFDARPGAMDGTSIGNPGRYSLCLAEADPPTGWPTLREELGYDENDTTVTVMATEGPRQIANHLNADADGLIATFAASLRTPSMWIAGKGGQAVLVVGPEHAAALAEGGVTRAAFRERVVTESRIAPAELEAAGVLIPQRSSHRMEVGDDGLLATIASPDDLVVVTAGGAGAGWSACVPSWASSLASRAATRRVRGADEALPECGPDGCSLPDRLLGTGGVR